MLKIATFAPIPSARVSRVASVNIGVRTSRRVAWRTSRISSIIEGSPWTYTYGPVAEMVPEARHTRSA